MGAGKAIPNLRGALVGAMIAGIAGLAWSQWGASGIAGTPSGALRVVGIVVGLVIFVWSARLRRVAPGSGSLLFSSRAYQLVVALEVAALIGGAALLKAIGHTEYTIAWFAAVVGIHFLAFGRLFWVGFYWLGSAMIAAGVAGVIVGLLGGGLGTIDAVAGLIAAASLFAAGASTIVRAQVAALA